MQHRLKKKTATIRIIACFFAVLFFVFLSVGCGFGNNVKKASKNLTKYDITINYDDQTQTASCVQNVDYINQTGTDLCDVCFHLYPRAFREGASIAPYTDLTEARCYPNGKSYGSLTITELSVGGENKKISYVGQDEDILQVELLAPLKNGQRTKIAIKYVLALPNCTHRFGYYDGCVNFGNFYPIVCAFENGEWDTTPYYPTGDPFNSEVANYAVSISYPPGYDVAGSGKQIVENVDGDRKTSAFEALAVRDFAIVLGNNFEVRGAVEGKTQITYYGFAGDEDLEDLLKTACLSLRYFNKTFGEYPYEKLAVVKTAFVQGGMEYPNLIMVSRFARTAEEKNKIIVHEVAHQWWYGVVGNNEIVDAWIDEGLCEFSTVMFFGANPQFNLSYNDQINDALSSYNLYVEVFKSIGLEVNNKMNLPVYKYASEYEYTYMIYVRGVLMMDKLKSELGENVVIKSLKKLYSKYQFKKIGLDEFVDCFGVNKNRAREIVVGFVEGNAYIDKT
ncbi:MAG: M1 family metallopeptidase [Clostridia bacterium]|nr:M1 family metallopeptidase [Clostridia bacterium]